MTAPNPLSEEEIAVHLFGQVKIRMDHRLNCILERDGAEKAITGPGVRISYLFASEIHRACERSLLVISALKAERDALAEEVKRLKNA